MFYLFDATLFAGFFALLLGFGLAVTPKNRSVVAALVFAPAGFLGVWATLFYLAGCVGAFQPLPFWALALAVLAGVSVWKRADLRANMRRLFAALRATSRLERALLAYGALVAGGLFVLSLVPPGGADYDSLVYHLAVPAQWLRAGRVTQLPFDHHSYFPFVGEMLYALALGVRGEVLAKLFHWAMLVFGALALCVLGRRAGGKTAGLWAAALFVSLPMTQVEATTAYIDLTFSAFAWAAIALFCEALFEDSSAPTRRANWLGCGAFCGLCLGSKYFGWLIFGFLGLWLLVETLRGRNLPPRIARGEEANLPLNDGRGEDLQPHGARLENARSPANDVRARWQRLFWLGAPALLLGGFWYARNFAWTGNPVFPFAFSVFGGRGWTRAMATAYDADLAGFGFGKSALDLILLPFRLAMSPLNIGISNGQPKGLLFWPLDDSMAADASHSGFFDVPGVLFSVFPGPVLLAAGVPALLARKKGAMVGFLAWMFAFLWLFWALTSQQIRYLFPALGILCVLSGWMLSTRLPRFALASRVAGVCLAAWLVFSPAVTLWRARGTFSVIRGAQTPDDYLRRTFAGYEAMRWIGDHTPATSRVAVYGEPRDYYLPRPYFWADDPHNNLVPYEGIQTPAQLAGALKSLGATHVLINRDVARSGGAFGPPQPLFDQTIAQNQLRPLFSSHGFEVYELR